MTDLDNTQIIDADESLVEKSSTNETEASLKVIQGANSTVYSLGKETIIGRSSPSTLIISAPSLSKQHAKINLTNSQFFITDLGSSNKTFQNKIQLQPNVCYALHGGDEIKLGDLLCTFQEQKLSSKTDQDTLSEPSHQTYVPVVNTLVEEDSPWNLDNNDEEEEEIRPPKAEETNVEVIPTTQTISDSYDDEETPTQPVKIWNGNSNNNRKELTRLSHKRTNYDDVTAKSNGVHDATTNGSSAFISSSTENLSTDDHDDGSLVIGSSTLPTTVVESTQIINDDQVEIVSTVQTKQIIEKIDENTVRIETTMTTTTTTEVEIENTQSYELELPGEIKHSNGLLAETQAYEMESEAVVTDVVETKQEEIHKVVIDDEETIEKVTTTITTTTKTVVIEENEENPPLQTLAYDLQAAPRVIESNIDNGFTQVYDIDEQIEITAKSPRKIEENITEIPIIKTTTKTLSNEIPETQLNDDMIEPTATLVNDEKAAETETQVNDEMEPVQTLVNDDSPAETQVNDQMESAQTLANDIDLLAETQVNDEMEVEQTESEIKAEESTVENKINQNDVVPTESETTPLVSTLETEENEVVDDEEETGQNQRGLPRRNARRARGRPAAGATGKTRVVSTKIYGQRRKLTNASSTTATNNDETVNTTLEETIPTENEEETSTKVENEPETTKNSDTQPIEEPSTPNIRVSARIKARASSGRNRPFPYTDDYVDLDDLEKQTKASTASSTRKSSRSSATATGRTSSTSQKRISVRQQAAETNGNLDETTKKAKDQIDVDEDMETGGENEEPVTHETTRTSTVGRKRQSTTTTNKRSRGKQTSDVESSTTPKRSRKSAKDDDKEEEEDRPVRIALSSHLNFDQNHLDVLRQIGFEIMDESCQVDALVVDRIRRTKKFFMCLARGAHILSPKWIEEMIKEHRYLPYDKFYLDDTTAETRYGFHLRESVRLAKQRPIFSNYKIFCTKDTSPPFDDLKDIVEAAGGKFLDKINTSRPGKDLICIVAQTHKNEYEDLYKKGVPIVSEEFALSGISKQKLDFESFSVFQPAATSTGKTTGTN